MTLAQRSRGGKSTTNEGRACGATLEDHSAQCVLHSRLALMIVSIWINHEKKKILPGYFYALPKLGAKDNDFIGVRLEPSRMSEEVLRRPG